MATSDRLRKSTNRVAESKGESMSGQEQQRMDDQFETQIPEEGLMDEVPGENEFPNAEFSGSDEPEDDWDDDESYLEDSTGRQMLYWVGGGVLILVVIAALFFFVGGSSEPAGDISGVSKKVQDMESRLTELEAATNSWSIAMDRLAQNQQTVIDQNTRLMAKVDELKRKVEARPAPTPAKPRAAVAPKPKPAAAAPAKASTQRRYHVVQKGDTLYSIHKKYAVPLDTLRKLNGLKEHQPIYSGDKLYVE